MHILYKGFGRNVVKNKAFARKVSEVMYVHKGANYRVVRFKNSLDDVVRILNTKKYSRGHRASHKAAR